MAQFAEHHRRQAGDDAPQLTPAINEIQYSSTKTPFESLVPRQGAGQFTRQPERDGELIDHSDRGSQCVSIRYSERLAEAGIGPPVGSKGDSYINALAETIDGLDKAEVMRRQSWPTRNRWNWPP